MDANDLLHVVEERYANLKSFAAEILSISESGDEASFNRGEQRSSAFFVAPDKIRLEQGGSRGSVTVTNGVDVHHYFGAPKRYSKSASRGPDMLPGLFRPEFPIVGGLTVLFNRIAEKVAHAELLRVETLAIDGSETLCNVVSVTYETPPYPQLAISTSPVMFWVDSSTQLIVRLEGEITHRIPAHDATHTTKYILVFNRLVVDEPIAPETFEYVPPANALDTSDPRQQGGCISMSGGSGGASYGPGKIGRFENWNSHDWAGETLIEQSKLKLHGVDVAFERRLTVSEDRTKLQIVERITSPKGETQREFTIPVG